jgi:hypothetical protein
MPGRRAGGAAAALPDGRLLVVGGYDARGIAQGLLASCDLYDPFLECWKEGGAAPLRRARWGHGCAALDGKVYAVGGCSLQANAHPQEAFMETLRCCEVYIPAEDRWDKCAPLQVARSGSRVVALGSSRLAAVGGCDDVFGRAETQATVEIYDAIAGHWELLSSRLARPRTSAAVAAIGDSRLLIAGGAPSQLSVEVYSVGRGAGGMQSSASAARSSTDSNMDGAGSGSSGSSPRALLEEDDEEQAAKPVAANQMMVADMLEGRMGCQAAVVRLPSNEGAYPVCDREYVLVVGGERCDEAGDGSHALPRVRQLCTVAAYDIETGQWCDEDTTVPPMTVPRTTVSLCLGIGRVATARLTA